MTSQNVLQIALVTGAACLFIGFIGCSLFDLYRKGGQRDLEKWLDAEVEQGIELLRRIESHSCAKLTINGQEVANIATINFNVSSNGTGSGAIGDPGHVDDRPASSFRGNCHDNGLNHRYGVMNSQGEVKRLCIYCGHPDGSAA